MGNTKNYRRYLGALISATPNSELPSLSGLVKCKMKSEMGSQA